MATITHRRLCNYPYVDYRDMWKNTSHSGELHMWLWMSLSSNNTLDANFGSSTKMVLVVLPRKVVAQSKGWGENVADWCVKSRHSQGLLKLVCCLSQQEKFLSLRRIGAPWSKAEPAAKWGGPCKWHSQGVLCVRTLSVFVLKQLKMKNRILWQN